MPRSSSELAPSTLVAVKLRYAGRHLCSASYCDVLPRDCLAAVSAAASAAAATVDPGGLPPPLLLSQWRGLSEVVSLSLLRDSAALAVAGVDLYNCGHPSNHRPLCCFWWALALVPACRSHSVTSASMPSSHLPPPPNVPLLLSRHTVHRVLRSSRKRDSVEAMTEGIARSSRQSCRKWYRAEPGKL